MSASHALRHLLLPLSLCPGLVSAQQVLSNGGADHHGAPGSIAYTIGEPVTTTVSQGASTLTQGFHQAWVVITSIPDHARTEPAGITVYPNPVRHTLHVNMERPQEAQHYGLYDGAGHLVTSGRIANTLTAIDMEDHASGAYVLRLFGTEENIVKSFKISITH